MTQVGRSVVRSWIVRLCRALVALVLVAFVASAASAQDNPYFRGKTISLIYGGGTGGGYDTYARMLQPHYGRHIPGNPRIIVRSVPGAGTLVAANYLYEIAQATARRSAPSAAARRQPSCSKRAVSGSIRASSCGSAA